MALRLSSPAQRGALLAVAFVTASMLFYFSVRNAMAIHYSGLQTPQGFQRAVSLEPADARNWYLLGRYWQYNLEDPDASRAIRSYVSALSLDSNSAEMWSDLATAYESENNFAAARDAFLHARRAYPLSAGVAWRYGNFLLRQGEIDSAFSEMRLAVRADPHRAAEAFSRALRAGSNIETAIDRVLPPVTEAYLGVVWDQTTEGHTDNALKVWDRLPPLHPRISLHFLVRFSLPGQRLDDRETPHGSQPSLGPGGPFRGPGRSAEPAKLGFVGRRIRIKYFRRRIFLAFFAGHPRCADGNRYSREALRQ
jgi:hypothetical protein